MIKKYIAAGFLLMILSACDQNVSAVLYVRDIQDLMSANSASKKIPIDINIDIFETGLANQCDKPEGKAIVDAVASGFEKAVLIGCEKIAGSMKDKMTIKATTKFMARLSDELQPVDYLIEFEAFNNDDQSDGVDVRFNFEKYNEIQQKLTRINMMANIKVEDANISLTVSNDLRESATVIYSRGVFADGQPLDFGGEQSLEPRQNTIIKFGNVKIAFLAKQTWARAFGIKRAS